MAINQAGDKQRYYVTCWLHSSGHPASDEIAATEEGDAFEWCKTKQAAEEKMRTLYESGRFAYVGVIDCGGAEYEVVDYLEGKRAK